MLTFAHFADGFENPFAGACAVWGDAAVWVPQALWTAYGDRDRQAAHYPGMVLDLESVIPRLSDTGLWDRDQQLGDWLDPDASPHEPWNAKAETDVVATEREHKVTTGFAGTPFVTWALSETGQVESAYRLLLEEGCPRALLVHRARSRECGWRRSADGLVVNVLVPAGVGAELVLPDGTTQPVSAGRHTFGG